MAETVISTNADLLTYDYATRADINRLAPHGDLSAWWVERHTSAFRLILDDLKVLGWEESDITDTDPLKRPSAAAAMRSALMLGGNGHDPDSDDGKMSATMAKEYTRLMNIIGPTIGGSEQIPRYRRRSTVSG
jgi:hypothetical protein